ncbi:hypothetical protein V8C26DRAFT_401054 [Trichoderma gracile]
MFMTLSPSLVVLLFACFVCKEAGDPRLQTGQTSSDSQHRESRASVSPSDLLRGACVDHCVDHLEPPSLDPSQKRTTS